MFLEPQFPQENGGEMKRTSTYRERKKCKWNNTYRGY
jgi:hypothetical protein